MKLSHLVYFHHCVFIGAILAAFFFGMLLQYNMKQAVIEAGIEGEKRGVMKVYINMNLKGLSEVNI